MSEKNEWKPIESAPKDGTGILGYWDVGGIHDCNFRAVKFHRDAWWETNEDYKVREPTHWMPLPAAPGTPPASAQDDAKDERSDTYGMNLGERIAHVGGRTNAQGYTEFGSPMAVSALIQHVLRDMEWTRQDDDGAYQARYRLPGGQWSTWGHVVCGVKGHEQELRYLPGERRHAPAAGDALDAARWRFIRRKLCLTGNGNGTCAMHAINLPASIPGWPEPGPGVAEFCDAAIDAALAAQVPQQGEA